MNDTLVPSTKEVKQGLPRPPAEGQETKTEPYSANQVAGSFCNFQQYGNGPVLYDYEDACKSGELWDARLQCSHLQSPTTELISQTTGHKEDQSNNKNNDEVENPEHDCMSLPNSDRGTPTYLKWAKDLNNLLEDREGVNLFRKYVKQEKCETHLEFWLACEGLKKFDPNSPEVVHLIKLIYKRFIKQALKEIKPDTKKDIENKINNKINMNQHMFDVAQKEIEDIMKCTAYPNFLESDVYLQHIRYNQNNTTCSDSLRNSKSCSSSSSREGLDILPTVHEDSELNTHSTRTLLTNEVWRQRFRVMDNRSRMQMEAHPNNFVRNHSRSSSSHHAKYSSFLPTSAQDSELQSLSSDAQTDDTSSLADSSIEYSPAYNTKSHCKKQLRAMKMNAGLNKDHFPCQLIPRTQRLPKSWLLQPEPNAFAMELIEKLNKVKQDRELEEKLEESMQKLEVEEKRNLRICDNAGTSMNRFAALPQQLISAVIQEKQSCIDESDQSILDQHMSRVWKDSAQQTPSRSPPLSPTPDRCKSCLAGNQLLSPRLTPQLTNPNSCRPSSSGMIQNSHQTNRVSPYNLLPAMTSNTSKHRKERDTHSSDSGTVHDFTPENEPASYNSPPVHIHKHIHHHTTNIFSPNVMSSDQTGARANDRRSKDNSRRSNSKKVSTDSSSSCVDSGVSVACEPLPISSARERTCSWIGSLNDKYTHGTHTPDAELETSARHKKSSHSSTSAMPTSTNRSSHCKKPLAYSSSRSGSLERGGTSPWLGTPGISSSLGQGNLHSLAPVTYAPLPHTYGVQPSQPLAQDPSMPMLPQPDTTTQLVEARRRLEDEARTKAMKTRRQNKKFSACGANSNAVNNTTNDITVIGYCFAGEAVPYRTKLPGKNITLKQFKSLLSKKGNYRYFFKKASDEFGTGIINEEITDDNEVLPLWEEKIFAIIQPIE